MKLFAVVAATTAMVASAAADNYNYVNPFMPVPTMIRPDSFLTPRVHTEARSPVDIHFTLQANCSAPAYYKCKGDAIPKNGATVSVEENAITVTIAPKHRPKYTFPALKPVERPTTKPPTKPPHKYGYSEDSYDSYDSYDEDDHYHNYKRPTRPVKPGKLNCELESFRLLAISQHTVVGNHHPLEVELLHNCNNGTAIAIVNQFYNVKDFGPEPKPTYYKPTKKSYYKKPTKNSYDRYDKKDNYVEKYLELNQENYVAPRTEDPYHKTQKPKYYDSDDSSDDDYYHHDDKDMYYKKDSEISIDEWSKEATIILKKVINTVAAQLINVTTDGAGYYKTYTPTVSKKEVPLPFKFKAKFLSYWGKGAYGYTGTTTWTTKANSPATVFITGHALETDQKVPAFCELVHSLDTGRPYEQYNNRRLVALGDNRPMWKFCGSQCSQEWDNVTCPAPPVKPTYKPKKYEYKNDDDKKDDHKKDDHKKDDHKKDDRKY